MGAAQRHAAPDPHLGRGGVAVEDDARVQGWPPRTIGPRGKGVESQSAGAREAERQMGPERWRSLIVQDPW